MPDAAPTNRARLKRVAFKVLRIIVFAWIGLSLVLALFQTQFIFPGAATQGRRDAVVNAHALGPGAELVTLRSPAGEKIMGLFGPALDASGRIHADSKSRPTLLYFYGNGMCMADCEREFQSFRRRGFNVMVAEYLGYGMSGGKPSEAGVYATADACFDHLLSRPDVDPKRIVPFGWSLGSGAAFHLAATRNEVPCVVTVSALTSVDAMARRLFPYLPTSLILQHHFDNEKKVRGLKLPIFLGHGTRDGIVPFDMSQTLAAAATSAGCTVVKYDVIGGDHNDVYDIGGTGLLEAITDFVNEHVGDLR